MNKQLAFAYGIAGLAVAVALIAVVASATDLLGPPTSALPPDPAEAASAPAPDPQADPGAWQTPEPDPRVTTPEMVIRDEAPPRWRGDDDDDDEDEEEEEHHRGRRRHHEEDEDDDD